MSTLSVVPPSEPVEEIYIGSKPNWTDPDVAINSAVWFHQEGAADWEKVLEQGPVHSGLP